MSIISGLIILSPHYLSLAKEGFPDELTFSVPRLLQFMNAGENIRFQSTKFRFSRGRVALMVYPPGEGEIYVLAGLPFLVTTTNTVNLGSSPGCWD